MLTLPLGTRILVCREPVDMRRSFDGLEASVRERLKEDPLSGALFVFWNRRRDRLKILSFDGTGLWIWYKRLERGRFELPGRPGDSAEVTSADLLLVLEGIELASARRRRRWRRGALQPQGFSDRNHSPHAARSTTASRRPGAAAQRDLAAVGSG
jgi:transposase